ncbi:hypothetical protein B0T26DRAFT_688364 [Lasiosphaeria miniovina]|uniref:Regulator of Ty1 transposition protein 10 n=1 Tax=Lasiosphaeria miniovina TaxID=1954250 RepID=A0AA40BHR8_9PEZI|nr:uncharacterized protein B0T26DRAFT_688364 [Lasiosphaeria miniovina]KAK0734410.1 hypothetical protein B0T26DRAFT_688364 [Lasiosphaeria miniovina]
MPDFHFPSSSIMAAEKRSSSKSVTKTKLRHSYLSNPVTALEFYCPPHQPGRVLVLAGEDTWLKVYDVASSRLLGQLKIFYSEPIHGIYVSRPGADAVAEADAPERTGERTGDGRVLVWGGHSVTVLPQESLQALVDGCAPVQQPHELRAADWIYDGILFPSDTATNGALVTAHNEIVPLSVSGRGPAHALVFGPLTSPSRPILYSANLCLLSPTSILVAGGTVFGEIIVWKYHLDAPAHSSPQWELLYVFTGHEGSIFGVSISPEIELAPDGTSVRLLASCSDDRTIRIWDITDRPLAVAGAVTGAANGETQHTSALAEARETGFGGSNSEVKSENKHDSARCLAVAMGHASRIWHVRFTGRTNHHSPQASPIEVHSFGEDCSRQKWELTIDLARLHAAPSRGLSDVGAAAKPEDKPLGTLRLRSACSAHIGKNIWSAVVSSGADGVPVIATGGADGKIAISGDRSGTDGPDVDSRPSYGVLDIDQSFHEIIEKLHRPEETLPVDLPAAMPNRSSKDGFQRYAFISDNTVLATTTAGRLLLGTVGETLAWEEVTLPPAIRSDLNSFSLVKSPALDIAVIGSASGSVYLLQPLHEIKELAKLPGKISDMVCVQFSDSASDRQAKTWAVVVTVLGVDHATMLTFNASAGDSLVDSRQITLREHYIVTAASFCGGKLVLGSRVGAVTIYKTDANCFTPDVSRRDCKTKDAVTCIVPLPGSQTSFLTGCRDGRYRIYSIGNSNNADGSGAGNTTLHLQHEISPPMGMIEGAWFTAPPSQGDAELILHGFRGKQFVVWNETSRHELATVECGGGHRPFDCVSPAADAGQLRFVFTKAAHMRLYSQRRPALRALREGGHGREMRAAAACGPYVATAAEDTTIRIWQYRDSSDSSDTRRGFRCLAVLEKHSAGIQCLKWVGPGCLVSSAGSEELFVWRITRLDSSYEALAVVCEAAYPDRTPDGDLRIIDLDVQPWEAAGRDIVGGDGNGAMLISLVLSNSTLKSYLYSTEHGFQLLAQGHYTGACLTQIRHLRTPADGEGAAIHILTASTDGHVALWAASGVRTTTSNKGEDGGPAEFALASVSKLHQSTIKSLDMAREDAPDGRGQRLVVTGGDDNALGVLDLAWSPDASEFAVRTRARVRDAHAAAITGLCAVSRDGAGYVEVATASNDQRVKLWRAERTDLAGGCGFAVALLDDQYSSVADPGDFEVIAPGRLMVAGVGMEVWDLFQALAPVGV